MERAKLLPLLLLVATIIGVIGDLQNQLPRNTKTVWLLSISLQLNLLQLLLLHLWLILNRGQLFRLPLVATLQKCRSLLSMERRLCEQ